MDILPRNVIYGIGLKGERIRYVGMTTRTANQRLREHLRCVDSGVKTPFYDWLRVHRDEYEVTLLAYPVGVENLRFEEQLWIELLSTHISRGGLNMTFGGDGQIGLIISDETREKMSQSSKGRVVSESTRQKLRDQRIGIPLSSEHRAKLSESHKGKALLPSQLVGLAKHWGSPISEETKQKMRESRKNIDDRSTLDRGRHTRWHVNRGIIKPGCEHCG